MSKLPKNVHQLPAHGNNLTGRSGSRAWCWLGVHNYQVISSQPFSEYWKGELIAKKTQYHLRCACCGKMKSENL